MSFAVCLFYPRNEKEQNQWDYVLSHWKPSQIYLIKAEGCELRSVFKEAIKITSFSDLPSHMPLVMTAPSLGRHIQGQESLYDFSHPHDCIYFFGPNHKNLTLEDQEVDRHPNHLIYVPVDTNDEMYNWTTGAVVLYDRYLKARHG